MQDEWLKNGGGTVGKNEEGGRIIQKAQKL